MSRESDFLELLQCEFLAVAENAKSLNEELKKHGQHVLDNLQVSHDEDDRQYSDLEKELNDVQDLRTKVLENHSLHRTMLENGDKLKLKQQMLESQNDQLSEKIAKKAEKIGREKATMEAQKEHIDKKLLAIRKCSELFVRVLGLELVVLKDSRMQFLFRNLIPEKPDILAYVIVSLKDLVYGITESYPSLDNLKAIEDALNKTNDFGGFIQYIRLLLKTKLAEHD